MFSSLIKHRFPRASAFPITRLSRASVHGKAQPTIKAHEEFYVTTTFPDDFESSPLKLDDFQKVDQSSGKETPVVFDKVTTEKHMADIYESLNPNQPMAGMKKPKDTKAQKAPELAEQEPGLDEM